MEISKESIYMLHDIWTKIRPYVDSSFIFDENRLDETICGLHKNFLEHIEYLEITIDDLAENRNQDSYDRNKELEDDNNNLDLENKNLKKKIKELEKQIQGMNK